MTEIQSETIARVNLVRLPWHCDKSTAESLSRLIGSWESQELAMHVLDLTEVRTLLPTFYKVVTEWTRSLKSKSIPLFSIHASPELLQQFKRDGLQEVFNPIASLQEALLKSKSIHVLKPGEIRLDRVFFGPLVAGITEAIQSLQGAQTAFQQSEILKPHTIKDPDKLGVELGATAEVSNLTTQGKVAIYFTSPALKELFEKSTQLQFESAQASRSQDLVREVLNMTMGRAKADWKSEQGLALDRSLPKTLVGDSLQEHLHSFIADSTLLKLELPAGELYLGVQLGPKNPTA